MIDLERLRIVNLEKDQIKMPLQSTIFRNEERLQSCAINDVSHLILGTKGHHVRLVQTALVNLNFGGIHGREYVDGHYGQTTADAVLRYKTSRKIINFSYQTRPDNIVGKMTITMLDGEMRDLENRMALR